MKMSRSRALFLGVASIFGIICIQAFNSFACYDHDVQSFLDTLRIFVIIPLLPALISLLTSNPLRAFGACLLFAPWLMLAYYADCVEPHAGASMVYVAVILWGTPSSIIGALVTSPIMRLAGVSVGRR
jgi:hypothetical protein